MITFIITFTNQVCYMGVTRSRKIDSDRDYQKNKERVQEFKVLWKKEKLHSTINKYIETLTFTWLQASYSQIITLKMLNPSPRFDVDHHFLYGFSFLPRTWLLSGMQISSTYLSQVANIRALSINRISVAAKGESISAGLFSSLFFLSTRWLSDVPVTVMTEGSKTGRPFASV